MAKPKQLPSGSWRVQIRRKGFQRIDEVFKTEEDANEFIRRQVAEQHTRRAEALKSDAGNSAVTVRAAWEGYRVSITASKKRPATLKREAGCAKHVLRLLGDVELRLLDEAALQEYIERRTGETTRLGTTAGDTVRIEKGLLSQLFKWAILRRHVKRNPARGGTLEMPECKERIIRIDADQQAALRDAAVAFTRNPRANKTAWPWLRLTMACGLRPGEAAKIELAWCKLRDAEIHIPGSGHKNKRPRLVVVPDHLLPELREQAAAAKKAGSPYLFWSDSPARAHNKPVPYRYHKAWAAICKRAGVPPSTVPHGMRHEYISTLYETTDLSDSMVAEMAGDVHVASLQPYRHLRKAAVKERHQAVNAQREAEFKARLAEQKAEWAQRMLDELQAKRNAESAGGKDEPEA